MKTVSGKDGVNSRELPKGCGMRLPRSSMGEEPHKNAVQHRTGNVGKSLRVHSASTEAIRRVPGCPRIEHELCESRVPM